MWAMNPHLVPCEPRVEWEGEGADCWGVQSLGAQSFLCTGR